MQPYGSAVGAEYIADFEYAADVEYVANFEYVANAARIVFGSGTIARLRDEVGRLGATRVLLVHDPGLAGAADRAAETLGAAVAARFDGVAMHTPVEVTERALAVATDARVDCLVSLGGGSSTGLGKALALRTGLPLIAVPSTYAGSEVTPLLGETAAGEKTTQTNLVVLPRTVVYDVDLTLGLPAMLSVTSGVNAMAHAVEAFYSPQANPVVDQLAAESLRRLAAALPRIVAEPSDLAARSDALIGAWLAGTCLGTVGMSLHHKLCHTLGGSFGLPHAETHTVVLPHAMAYNAGAAPEAMAKVARALGVGDAPSGVYDLVASLGGPTSLAQLGFRESDIGRAAELASARPYPNPRPVTRDGIAALLHDAWAGTRPNAQSTGVPDLGWLTDEVVASFDAAPNPRVKRLVTDLVRHLHRFVNDNDVTESEWAYAIDFLTRAGHLTDDRRQEFVLLSDTLGVSSMVDLLTNSRTPDTTPSAVLGPFYVADPPVAAQGSDISRGTAGTPLWTDVRVTDPDGKPVSGATVDVWQSNDDGFYDVQLPDQDGPALRARFASDDDGRVCFWSILPSEYPIPADGPVGQMLAATGRHPYRAPHLHFMIAAPGYRRLVTQLFVAGGAYLDSDTVFGVKEPLVVEFGPGEGDPPAPRPEAEAPAWRPDGDPQAPTDGWHQVRYTFRIAPDRGTR
jgi:alcohol dehydrogenase class IV/protocatechuate 3,4-dioxygenase beta subunit